MSGTTPATSTLGKTTLSDGFFRRRSGLIVPAVMLLISVGLAIGVATMEVPANVPFPGPKIFPAAISMLCAILATLIAIHTIRDPEPAHIETQATDASKVAEEAPEATFSVAAGDSSGRPKSNYRALLSTVAVLVVFVAALQPIGWLISGAFLYWGMAWALGSRRQAFDAIVAIAISSTIQLTFSAGLGLNLPPGLLAGGF